MIRWVRAWHAQWRLDGLVDESIRHARAHGCHAEDMAACPHWDALQFHISHALEQLTKASR